MGEGIKMEVKCRKGLIRTGNVKEVGVFENVIT